MTLLSNPFTARLRVALRGAVALTLAALVSGPGEAAAASPGSWSSVDLGKRSGYALAQVGSAVLIAGGRTTSDLDAVNVYDADGRAWSTASLSVARQGITAATVGTQVLLAGGLGRPELGRTAPSDVVDVYDQATGEWSTAALSVPRYGMGSATVGGRVLFAGGVSTQPVDAVDIYDADTGTWSTATLSEPRQLPTTITVGSQVLVVGGKRVVHDPSQSIFSDAVDIYDDQTGAWSAARLSHSGPALVATRVGNQVLVTDGQVVDVYDAPTGTWTSHPLSQHLTGERPFNVTAQPAVVSAATTVLVSVGRVLEIYDSLTGQWSMGPAEPARPPGAFADHHQAVLAGRTAVFSDLASQEVELYNLDTRAWSVATLPHARAEYALASVGGQALFAGGDRSQGPRLANEHVDVVDILDVATASWSSGSLAYARAVPRVANVADQVLFMGGVLACTSCPMEDARLVVDVYDSAPATGS